MPPAHAPIHLCYVRNYDKNSQETIAKKLATKMDLCGFYRGIVEIFQRGREGWEGGVHTVSRPGYRLDCQVNFAAEFHLRNDIVLDENRVRMGGVGGWKTCLQKSCMDEYVNRKRGWEELMKGESCNRDENVVHR